MKLTKGNWFHVYYFVRRDKKDGLIKLWFDDQLIGERSGIPTMHSKNDQLKIILAKIYHERGDKVPHQLWIDDFSLYDKID